MKVLVIGSGGREHALAWKCAGSPRVSEVLVAPGNAGTATEPKVRNVAIGADDIPALVQFAKSERVLESLASEALAEFRAGKAKPLDDL